MEFAYETTKTATVAKIILFYGLNDQADKSRQQIYRKSCGWKGVRSDTTTGVYDGIRAACWN
jgi:hypothetical protein